MITSDNHSFPFGAVNWLSVGRIEGEAEACALHPFAGCKHRQEEGPCGSGSVASGSRNVLQNHTQWSRRPAAYYTSIWFWDV